MRNDAELELVRGLQRGDSAAFATVVEEYGPRLVASGTRLLGDRAEAEDAVQETLVSVWKNVGKFQRASSLYSWMHRILINACLTRLRSKRATKEMNLLEDEASPPSYRPLSGTPQSQPGPSLEKRVAMRRVIEPALDEIPEEFRVVLLLRDVEELSSKEAGEQLGISDALVRQRLHRARTIMAEILRPELCSGPALTCGGRLDLLMDFIDDSLSSELFPPVDAHLRSCKDCSILLAAYRETIGVPRVLREVVEEEETDLPPKFLTHILERIAN